MAQSRKRINELPKTVMNKVESWNPYHKYPTNWTTKNQTIDDQDQVSTF